MNNFFKNTFITLISEAGIMIFGFLSLVILTRILGPEGKGLYSLILLVPSLLITFGSCGIGAANIYFTGNKKYTVEEVISNSVFFTGILSVILSLVLIFLAKFSVLNNFFHLNNVSIQYIVLIIISIPLSLLLGFFQNIIRGKEEIVVYNASRLVENGLNFLAIFALLVILRGGVSSAVFSYIISMAGACAFTVFLVLRFSKITLKVNIKLLKDSLSFGWKTYVANIVSFFSYRLDMFLLAVLLPQPNVMAQIGFYSIAVSIAEKMFIIPGSFSTVLFPRVSSVTHGEANEITPKVIRHTLFIILVASLFSFFLAKPAIVFIFGQNFLPSVAPFLALIPGIIAFSIGGVIAADLSGRGKPYWAIVSSITCVIINVILNFIMIPKWGIVGASIASSIAYWADTLVVLFAFLNISKKRLVDVLVIKKEDFKDYLYLLKRA